MESRIIEILGEDTSQHHHHWQRGASDLALMLVGGNTCTFRAFDSALEKLAARALARTDKRGVIHLTSLGHSHLERSHQTSGGGGSSRSSSQATIR